MDVLALCYRNADGKVKGGQCVPSKRVPVIPEGDRTGTQPMSEGNDRTAEAIWAPGAPAWLTQSTDEQRWLVEEMNQ